MKKLSLTLKISILVVGLIAALLLLAVFFVSQFSAVIQSSEQDSALRQFEATLVSSWDDLKVQYNLARVQAPEFFSKKLEQAELETTIGQAQTLEQTLFAQFDALPAATKASWDLANSDDGGQLEAYLARYNEALSSAQEVFAGAAKVWLEKGAWNQRSAADKGVLAAMQPMDAVVKEFSARFGTLVSYRSAVLIESQQATIRNLIISLVVLVLVVAIIAVRVLGKLKTDLGDIIQLTHQLAQGDLSQTISAAKNGDEVDEVKLAVATMTEKLRSVVETVVNLASHLQSASQVMLKDTETRMQEAHAQRDQLQSLTDAVTQLEGYSNQVTQAARESQTVANSASESAHSGHNSVIETATAIEGLAEEIEQAVTVIEKLDDQAGNITTVIGTIQSIAEQTNLLALNAAIEAARAGEQGRGFAVVADEVRSLAHRTQQSTEEIQTTLEELRKDSRAAVTVIGGSHSKSVASVEKATSAGSTIKEFDSAVSAINDHATQTAEAAEQQSLTLQSITGTVAGVNSIAEHNAEQAKANIAASEELNDLSADLTRSIAYFQLH